MIVPASVKRDPRRPEIGRAFYREVACEALACIVERAETAYCDLLPRIAYDVGWMGLRKRVRVAGR